MWEVLLYVLQFVIPSNINPDITGVQQILGIQKVTEMLQSHIVQIRVQRQRLSVVKFQVSEMSQHSAITRIKGLEGHEVLVMV